MIKKIAIAVNKNDVIWYGHFGISPYFLIYDNQGELLDKRINPHGVGNSVQHHDNPKLIIELLNDCNIFIGKRMGNKSKNKLVEKFNIKTILTEETKPDVFVASYLESNKSGNDI